LRTVLGCNNGCFKSFFLGFKISQLESKRVFLSLKAGLVGWIKI
jgi:hypothetical protein